jgi:major membrane immunogen (membrane-anchored lipoprotein)
MKKALVLLMIFCMIILMYCGCARQPTGLQNGYYTAEMKEFDANGWKEYITIYVSENRIIAAEYDAYNASGLVKSWDINYMRAMKAAIGAYPNEYTRLFAQSLVDLQAPAAVQTITGATYSNSLFLLLAEAVIEKAKTGDKHMALVESLAKKDII